jgi:hypothetical protein
MNKRNSIAVFASIVVAGVLLSGGVGYAAAKIDTQHLANHAVTQSKVAPDAVTSAKLRFGSVGGSEIQDGQVGWNDLSKNARDLLIENCSEQVLEHNQ